MKASTAQSSIRRAGTGSNAGLPSIPKTERAHATTRTPCLPVSSLMIAGNRMSPSHATKRGRRHRYYVSQAMLQGRKGMWGPSPGSQRWSSNDGSPMRCEAPHPRTLASVRFKRRRSVNCLTVRLPPSTAPRSAHRPVYPILAPTFLPPSSASRSAAQH
jgi:hypothetical protein